MFIAKPNDMNFSNPKLNLSANQLDSVLGKILLS